MKMRYLLIILLIALPLCGFSKVELKKGHPYRYIVKPGDTLWGIAARFLKQPWQWNQVWQGNPQITYPNDLYPGDVLELHLENGRPIISLVRGKLMTVKLSPRTRVLPLRHPIPTIPIDAIKPFLSKTQVFNRATLKNAPYIVALAGEHITGGAGNDIYVRSIYSRRQKIFSVYRLTERPYVSPRNKKDILGYQGTYIGSAILLRPGDPALLKLQSSTYEALVGDRLLPANENEFSNNFMPHAPNVTVNGDIIGVLGEGITQIGEYNTVVIDRGRRNHINVGDVLDVYRRGKDIVDRVTRSNNKRVTLPDQLAGQAMVYRVFPRVSYAIILDTTLPIRLHDKVANPNEGQYD